ncbi:MAG: SPOR domain-containing protein [Bacteroidetes bacterium]|nr:SPOR domain-containing protein [Bacteroidota bacterium]
MKKKLSLIFMVFFVSILSAQMKEEDVRARLEKVYSGKTDEVRNELPSLEREFPNDAGVKYIDAFTTRDGASAAQKYQQLVDQFPQSVWADAALYRVYQYYYSVGLYKTAETKMAQLQQQYPNSIYIKRDISAVSSPVEVKPQIKEEPTKTEAPVVQPEVKQETVSTEPEPVSSSPYVVQVGVFSTEAAAKQQASKTGNTVGRQAIVFTKMSGGKQMFAVAFEGFETEQSARNYVTELKTKFNIDAFFVKR